MKVVFYGRYSSHSQTEQSIEGQLHVCEQYAEQNGLEIVHQYVDRAYSGTSDNRPQFQQMISDSETGAFEGILVYKLDRFSRSRYDSAIYKKKLRDKGIRIFSAMEAITDTPEGIIMEALVEGMDEYYSAELARKMHRGLTESFKKGRFINTKTPFGYCITADRRLIPDKNTAPVVQEIFRQYAEGKRFRDIIQWLDAKGIRNNAGKQWKFYNLTYLLHNRLYKGEYTRSDMDGAVMPCPALVTEEMFAAVQNKLAERAHRHREHRTGFDYILTSRLYCANCGSRMYGTSVRRNEKTFHYYKCGNCKGQPFPPALMLHERVLNAVREYLTEEKLDEIASAAFNAYTQTPEIPDTYAVAKKELAEVNQKLDNAINAVLSGFASDSLKMVMQELENRKTELTAVLENTSPAPPRLTFEHFRFALQVLIEKANCEEVHQLLDAIVNRVVIKNEVAIICINLTDEGNEPPLEQFSVELGQQQHPQLYTKFSGWLLIAA